jgi:hypothetical protein
MKLIKKLIKPGKDGTYEKLLGEDMCWYIVVTRQRHHVRRQIQIGFDRHAICIESKAEADRLIAVLKRNRDKLEV